MALPQTSPHALRPPANVNDSGGGGGAGGGGFFTEAAHAARVSTEPSATVPVSTTADNADGFANAIAARYANATGPRTPSSASSSSTQNQSVTGGSGGSNTGGFNFGPQTPAATVVISPSAMSFPALSDFATMALSSPPPPLSLKKPPPGRGPLGGADTPSSAPTPTPPAAAVATPPTSFAYFTPADLPGALSADANTDATHPALILDIRPHTAYAYGRIRGALGLPAPSTLLRRPAFGLERLAGMLATPSARTHFSRVWSSAPLILVYDADAGSAPPGSSLHGLLAKFAAGGVPLSRLRWLRGGFNAAFASQPALVDASPPALEEDAAPGEDAQPNSLAPAALVNHTSILSGSFTLPNAAAPPYSISLSHPALAARHLPLAAFTTSSTTASSRVSPTNASGSSVSPSFSAFSAAASAGFNPNAGAHPRTAASNPFFDNIRQNYELGAGRSSARGTGDVIPLRLPQKVSRRVGELPTAWLREIGKKAAGGREERDGSGLAEELAGQFFAIERAEQKRLMGIMAHHSKVLEGKEGDVFAFGITAGFEKGEKNRYRNIWPFEHARVRLHSSSSYPAGVVDDYVNASYVQPLGTRRRYIATQGPLNATLADFWTLVWEQDVHVLVALTREREGGQEKCAPYWIPGKYGSLTLSLIESTGTPEDERPIANRMTAGSGAGFFSAADVDTSPSKIVKRVFELSHAAFPRAGKRRVTQLHYLGWDDMNVPEDADAVLSLVRAADEAAAASQPSAPPRMGKEGEEALDPQTGVVRRAAHETRPPVLLHCSAGIGRTGGFIAVDALLDGVRREIRAESATAAATFKLPPLMQVPVGVHGMQEEMRRPGMKRWISSVPGGVPERGGEDERRPTGTRDSFEGWAAWASGSGGGRRSPPLMAAPRMNSTTTAASINPALAAHVPPEASARSPATADAGRVEEPETEICYRPPRALHQPDTPVPLSSLGPTPVYAVLADMREQRMSLVQSLRQYVFVHLAVLQGALELLDEERAATSAARAS